MNRKYIISWFNKDGEGDEFMVGRSDLKNVHIAELQELFGVPSNEIMSGGYPVEPCQVQFLQKHTDHVINLHKYDYFVEDRALTSLK